MNIDTHSQAIVNLPAATDNGEDNLLDADFVHAPAPGSTRAGNASAREGTEAGTQVSRNEREAAVAKLQIPFALSVSPTPEVPASEQTGAISSPETAEVEVAIQEVTASPMPSNEQAVTRRVRVPVGRVVLWDHVLGNREWAKAAVDARADEIAAGGRLKVCRGRWREDDVIEIVAGVLEFLAVEKLAASGSDHQIEIDVEPMDDLHAFQIAHAEAADGIKVYAVDRALFLKALIDTTGKKAKEVADMLGIQPSTVSRALDVLKTRDVIGSRIHDFWNVSADQSDRFIKLWNDKARRPELKAFINTLEPATARKIFAAIRDHFGIGRKLAKVGVVVRGDDGFELGMIGHNRAKETIVTLSRGAGDVDVDSLMDAVRAAMTEFRNG